MKTMRRLIITLLLASTLFANLSWATDTDAEVYFGHSTNGFQDQSSVPDSHANHDSCNHCCHSISHLTGLTQQNNISHKLSGNIYTAMATGSYRTHTPSPPTPPPNI